MKRAFPVVFLLFAFSILNSQVEPDYFLPSNVTYDTKIPTPKQFAGHEIGEWHLSHDKLYHYMQELDRVSGRAVWEEYGRSHENRPLGQLIISSPENILNIEKLRQEHIRICDPSVSGTLDLQKMPLFVKLGYGIHGNESSSQNAAALVAYYLIAGQGSKMDELLKNTVILIDPSLNPDGMQRHSTWVNSTRSLNNNPDVNSWEFSETWPGGRTNHYWFDLNRDYSLLQHPESTGRVAAFYRWRPNIITDHHEMGANETFFFQPGVQSRNNPLTPPDNQSLTAEIGKFHERHLNAIGSLYYTEESYDDYYLGKGSSYPDVHGSVGILFEQAGVKGHLRNTPGGVISFPFAIRNQFTVSLSSLEAGMNMRLKLLESQRNFYTDAIAQADLHPVKAYVFSESEDNSRVKEFISILLQHHIKVYRLSRDFSKNGVTHSSASGYIVPVKQEEYRFVRSLFEPATEFTDSVFYDISTWVLPMMFNIQYTALGTREITGLRGAEVTSAPEVVGKVLSSGNTYAYLFEWNEYLSPRALYMLQDAGVKTRVATDRFTWDDGKLKKDFGYGTILVPVSVQQMPPQALAGLMDRVAAECGLTVYGINSGLTPQGIDIGSSRFAVLRKPSVLMFAGDGASSADAGEIWHMLDTRFNMPVTLVTPQRFAGVDLSNYNVIIVAGSPSLSQGAIDQLRTWNRSGGTLIGYKSGNNWLSRNQLIEIEFIPPVTSRIKTGIYANRSGDAQVHQIPGSIFEATLDLTHPLCYGYTRDRLPVLKSGAGVASKNKGAYSNPATYSNNPLLSGYCSKENLDRIKESALVSVHNRRIISIYDNTNFRAIAYGTNKLFLNAIFFGQIL